MGEMGNMKKDAVPKFKTLNEEREYWEARGPLADGHKGAINKPRQKQKRSSFLAVRLTGEELTRLRDMASEQGLGPSTFARVVLSTIIQQNGFPKRIPFDDFVNAISSRFSQEDMEKYQRLIKDVVIGDPDNPALLIYSGQRKAWEEFTSLFLERILGVRVMPTKNDNYQKIVEIAKVKSKKEEIQV
jgi:predicted DNA binding CopG/RHH family protein